MEQNLLSRRRQGLSINKFKLVMILTTPKSMDRWIEYVLKSDVEELDLDFFDIRWKNYPLLPGVLFAKSISVIWV